MKRSPTAAAIKTATLLFTLSFWQSLKRPKETRGPAIAIEKVFAPREVSPPWARSIAWKMRTIIPRRLVAAGPKRIAPMPVPVIWEQLPVTDGILREEITKMNAPLMARIMRDLRLLLRVLRIEKKPATRKGTQTAPQAMQ